MQTEETTILSQIAEIKRAIRKKNGHLRRVMENNKINAEKHIQKIKRAEMISRIDAIADEFESEINGTESGCLLEVEYGALGCLWDRCRRYGFLGAADYICKQYPWIIPGVLERTHGSICTCERRLDVSEIRKILYDHPNSFWTWPEIRKKK